MRKPSCPRRQFWLFSLFVLAAALLLVAFIPSLYPGGAEDVRGAGGPVRIGAPEPVRQATVISPYGPGFEYELVNRFCRDASCTPEWVNVPDRDTGFAMLRKGEIDVLVGFWGDLPESAEPLVAGKAYAYFNPVRISGASFSRNTGQDAGGPAFAIDALARTFSALIPAFLSAGQENGAPSPPFPVFSFVTDENGDDSEEMVLLDPASSALWLPFMRNASTRQIRAQTHYRWFWRDDGTLLSEDFKQFWKSPKRTAELAELTERYFGFLPKTLRHRDIMELADTLAERLHEYEGLIEKAARETGVPPLLLVAIIYQESRFDPHAVSETRVRGLMQLTAATAKMLDVDRKNPEECILGGARYLRDLWNNIGDKAADDWDRWFMALAAYNQGMSNLNRTIRLAQRFGGEGNTWADLKRVFPLSTTCRGTEAKSFVEKIRYYHFILHGLVALAPPETQNFAPLLALAGGDGGS